MHRAVIGLLGAIGVGLAAPAAAEEGGARWHLGGSAGVVLFDDARDLTTEEVAAAPGTSGLLGVHARLTPPWLLVELEATVGWLLGTFDDDSGLQALAGRFEAHYALLDGGVRPFVALGPTLTVAFTEDYGTDTDVGFAAGGGVMFDVAAGWGVRLDARWMLADGVAGAADDLAFTVGVDYAM